LGDEAHRNRFVDRILGIPRKDFLPFLDGNSDELVAHAKGLAPQHGAPYLSLPGRHRKEDLVQQALRNRRLEEGLVCVRCCQETCRTVKRRYGKQRPRLVFAYRPPRVLSFSFLDPDFGLLYLRLQTWFPFTCQAYVNGHDGLARPLQQQGLGFVQRDNAFPPLDQPEQAQRLAERFPKLPWVKVLNRWARLVNPLRKQPWLRGQRSCWVLDQVAYSTDLLFTDRPALAGL
jgi:hypothetical protein